MPVILNTAEEWKCLAAPHGKANALQWPLADEHFRSSGASQTRKTRLPNPAKAYKWQWSFRPARLDKNGPARQQKVARRQPVRRASCMTGIFDHLESPKFHARSYEHAGGWPS